MKYFHLCITCPDCKEPHLIGTQLEELDSDWFKCNNCGCIFTNKLKFYKERFPHTFDKVYRLNPSIPKESTSFIKLPWAVESNLLEQSYIDWLKELTPPNNILVTWPWKKVKFIPILIVQYLLQNEGKRVVVIDEIQDHEDHIIHASNIMESFDKMVFYDDDSQLNQGNTETNNEMKKIDSTDFIKLEKIVEYEEKRVGSKDRTKYTTDKSVIQCKNMVLKQLRSEYGENCVRNLTIKRLEKEKETSLLNPDGKIDLRIDEIKKYTGKFVYDKRWLWENLLNSEKIVKAKKKFPPKYLCSASANDNLGNSRLIFLNEEDHEFIFEKLREIKPGLVIFPNCDWFIKDKLMNGPNYRSLLKLLKQNNTSNIIMFSTNKDYRHLYNIYGAPLSEESNVSVHTCDSAIFLNKLWEKNPPTDKYYYNPLSSLWKEIGKQNHIEPLIKYVIVKSLDDLMENLGYLDEIFNQNLKRDIAYFFRELLKSFLDLYGNPSSTDSFKRKGNTLDILSYDSVMAMIKEKLGESIFDKFNNSLSSLYTFNGELHTNPLWEEAKKVLLELLQIRDNVVSIIVNYRDLKGTQTLINEISLSDADAKRVRISTWDKLVNIESGMSPNFNYVILATSYPSMGYSIYDSKANEFIFLGATANLEKTKAIVNNRLFDIKSRPFRILSEHDTAPNVVKEVSMEASPLFHDTIQEVEDDYVLSEINYAAGKYTDENEIVRHYEYAKIKSGEEALLIIDSMDNGMFIPVDSNLTVKEKEKLTEIDLTLMRGREKEKALVGKNILVDSNGLYRSFKTAFIIYMRKYAKNTVFRKGPYEWNGFEEIFADSQRWINDLRKTFENYRLKNNVTECAANNQLSEFLSTLSLNASDPEYIKKWWNDYEVIELGHSKYQVYWVEHPKSITDIQKIYEGINSKFPDMNLELANGERSYLASTFLQGFRGSLLSGRKLEKDLRFLHDQIKVELNNLVKESGLFRVVHCFKVKLRNEVVQLKTLNNYKDYLEP
jgi:hypothetical protein